MFRLPRFTLVGLTLVIPLILLLFVSQLAATGRSAAAGSNDGWPVFHHDPPHSGVAGGPPGNIINDRGPIVRWRFQIAQIPAAEITGTRWTSTFPLGDLNGDGTLEVVATTPNTAAGVNRIIALEDRPGEAPPVQPLWAYTTTSGLDMYSPALAFVDGLPGLDVIFNDADGVVRALSGQTGNLIWQYAAGRGSEAGVMVANMDGSGGDEVVFVTACQQSGDTCHDSADWARLIVLPTAANGGNMPIWQTTYRARLDSSVPALADIDPGDGSSRLAVIAGSWGGELLVAWQRPDGMVISDTFDLRTLDVRASRAVTPAVRSSPLVWDFGQGPTVILGWVPDPNNPGDGRISAIRLQADMTNGSDVLFTPQWTEPYDVWKSSPTLLPVTNPPLITAGYGLANQPNGQSGPVGGCWAQYVFGGIIALHSDGSLAWQQDYGNAAGNIRASAAVGDVDGDGQLEVVLPVGCYGQLYTYDGQTGNLEWQLQLGPRAQNSPSIGDLDGDGAAEIVLGSYDGYIWVLSGGARNYLPVVIRD